MKRLTYICVMMSFKKTPSSSSAKSNCFPSSLGTKVFTWIWMRGWDHRFWQEISIFCVSYSPKWQVGSAWTDPGRAGKLQLPSLSRRWVTDQQSIFSFSQVPDLSPQPGHRAHSSVVTVDTVSVFTHKLLWPQHPTLWTSQTPATHHTIRILPRKAHEHTVTLASSLVLCCKGICRQPPPTRPAPLLVPQRQLTACASFK